MAKILVVDDEKIITRRLKNLLDLGGYETFTASNAKEGLEIFHKQKPQIALVDIKMPGMDGIEMLKKIKEESRQTEVIIITGHGGVDTAIQALKEGAFGYIQKPIEYDELEIDIKNALEKQLMQEKLDEYVHNLEKAVEEKTRELELRKQAEAITEETLKELKETQDKLIQTEKMAALGELGAGAAHELNNPLAGIMGFAEVALHDLEDNKLDVEEIKRYLGIILEDTYRCKNIITNVLSFARTKEPELAKCDINSLIDDSIHMVMRQVSLQNIKIIKQNGQNGEGLPMIYVDGDQIRQVFINVILNARKAMPKGGELFIRSWREGNRVNIEFRDTGIGIEAEDLPKVFDPFFTTYRPGQGTGLGLSVSYGITKKHRGEIEAHSEGKNKGASFIVRLPVHPHT